MGLFPSPPLSCPTSPFAGRAPDGYGAAGGVAAVAFQPKLVWISVRPETSVPDSPRQCDALPAAFVRGLTVMTCGCRRGGADRGRASGKHTGPEPKPRNLDPSAARRPRPGRPPCASGYPTLLPPTEGGGGTNVSTTRSGPLARSGGERPEVLLSPLKTLLSENHGLPNETQKM